MKFNLLLVTLLFTLTNTLLSAQNNKAEDNKVHLINADVEEVKEKVFNGNIVYSGHVELVHQDSRIKADSIIYFQKENKLEARGNIELTNKITKLTSKRLTYDSHTSKVTASKSVKLVDKDQTVETEELIYETAPNVVYFNNWGTISGNGNVSTTKVAKYYIKNGQIELGQNSTLENKDYLVQGDNIIYNSNSKVANFNSPTTITEKGNPLNYILTDLGTYNVATKEAYLNKNNYVYYNNKVLTGDNIYFNQTRKYGKATGHVVIEDPIERQWLKGNYAEVFTGIDSAIVKGKPHLIKEFETDSLYFASDIITASNKNKKGMIVKGYHNGRLFKTDISGKSDSIVYNQEQGTITMFDRPIFWTNDKKQFRADTLKLYINTETNKLDSIYGYNNAFAISKVDTLSDKAEFNQVKGTKLIGYFDKENHIETLQFYKNAEALTFVDQEKKKEDGTKYKDRIGIGITTCGIIEGTFTNNTIEFISCKINAQSIIHPEKDVPEKARFLSNFEWRENERLRKWTDIFLKD